MSIPLYTITSDTENAWGSPIVFVYCFGHCINHKGIAEH